MRRSYQSDIQSVEARVAHDIAHYTPLTFKAGSPAITLMAALAQHHGATYLHSLRASTQVWALGLALGIAQQQARLYSLAGLLHDIGKLHMPRARLQEPQGLFGENDAGISRHPALGAETLQLFAELRVIAPCVAAQAERPDGKGYPLGLRQHEIPVGALLLAVVEVTDRLMYAGADSSDRDESISQILRSGAGSRWDPLIAQIAARERIWRAHTTAGIKAPRQEHERWALLATSCYEG